MSDIGNKAEKNIGVSDNPFLIGEPRRGVYRILKISGVRKGVGVGLYTRNHRNLYINNLGLCAGYSGIPSH